jgi:hypothetical protein
MLSAVDWMSPRSALVLVEFSAFLGLRRLDLYQDTTSVLAEKWGSEVDLCQGTNLFVPQSF